MGIISIEPVSMIDRQGRQKIVISYSDLAQPLHAELNAVSAESGKSVARTAVAFPSGSGSVSAFLPEPGKDTAVIWQISSDDVCLFRMSGEWKKPRHWVLNVMISSHTDIGLHNSQYIQRLNSEKFTDEAMALCDETDSRPEEDRYHYVMEGTWFFNNYGMDRGEAAARRLVGEYVRKGKIGVCGGMAGNHTQVFGREEICRATYGRKRLRDDWQISTHTMTMIDNNGLSWSVVQPFAEAGFRYIIFAPNQWNPLPSTVWPCDGSKEAPVWNAEAGGGGARIEMRFASALPRVFYWESADESSRLLVFGGGMYSHGGGVFGFQPHSGPGAVTMLAMETAMERQLPLMESKYPYDEWFTPCYTDDQEPDLGLTDTFALWNSRWAWPKVCSIGDPDAFFDRFTAKFGADIPVLRGDITGGWYQHPVAAPDLLARKFAADRLLPTAEKLSVLASLQCPDYRYPAERFNRAWDALLMNDEHSYGTSGYQGRRVYETWMQHRDWIEYAEQTGEEESRRALRALSSRIASSGSRVAVFNQTSRKRSETVRTEDGRCCFVADIPPLGYKTLPAEAFEKEEVCFAPAAEPPSIENRYYVLRFAADGSIASIFDKQLGRELLQGPANQFLYTQDNHKTFSSPVCTGFETARTKHAQYVRALLEDAVSGASVTQTVTLRDTEKRIDTDNTLRHVRGLFNNCRYDRYAYYAFPFAVENAKRLCDLGGCTAEYGKDLTGHTTDVYMAVNEWCCVQNDEMGVALIQQDSELTEFDRIHPDKTDYGRPGSGSAVYSYLANDWLQMHVPGGSDLNFRFRYTITSFAGTYQTAGVPQLAERVTHPVLTCALDKQAGDLPEDEHSFMPLPDSLRLIGLKRAEDGRGLIVRLYGPEEDAEKAIRAFAGQRAERAAADESDAPQTRARFGLSTWRLYGDTVRIPTAEAPREFMDGRYTGLITSPRASHGEKDGQMYLLWGRSGYAEAAAWRIYRGTVPGFEMNEASFVARAEPEAYCLMRYEDTGLENNKQYYYRVCAEDTNGNVLASSGEFTGKTRE